ncbi:hypothetical protein M3697_05405 [Janibacter melonis]|uniref:hypothetical protein n=1 Tax=Janibacter melonis TaxID=262209 RepID=UPI00204407AB|nr:hypothetical protein [Janibacter melonis]MCM3554542.1 hypothetical protein [Janibacter melonis]
MRWLGGADSHCDGDRRGIQHERFFDKCIHDDLVLQHDIVEHDIVELDIVEHDEDAVDASGLPG